MKIFDLLDGRDINRQRLFCLVRSGVYPTFNKNLLDKILSIANKNGTQIDLRFNSNFMNPLYFELNGYAMFHEYKIDETSKRNWGNHKQFLLDLCDLDIIIKVSFSYDESGAKMYVLGKGGEIVKEYISEEQDV